jgi:hypothetical protein
VVVLVAKVIPVQLVIAVVPTNKHCNQLIFLFLKVCFRQMFECDFYVHFVA